MSDNITREPYRNAWYKQLADAVKKHDEEIAEMTPHLVPNVEEGDNGKILIAGEDGAFDWGQPPEELPVITEGDEGKVLKVDEGVPKWLEDKDAEIPSHTASDEGKMLSVNAQNGLEWKDVPTEIPSHTASDEDKMLSVNAQNGLEWKDVPKELPNVETTDEGKVLKVNNGVPKWLTDNDSEFLVVTITRSGTSPNYTYTANKTYAQIRQAVLNGGKCILVYDYTYFSPYILYTNRINFYAQVGTNSFQQAINRPGQSGYGFAQGLQINNIVVNSDESIEFNSNTLFICPSVAIVNNSTVTDNTYNSMVVSMHVNATVFGRLEIDGRQYYFTKSSKDSTETEFTFYNYELGLKATVDSNKYCTITEIPKLPAPPSTDGTYTLQCTVSSGTPTYSWV